MEQQPLTDFQYKVVQPSSEDYKQSVIEKTGLKAQFTLAQVEEHQATLGKAKAELEGQIKVDSAMMQNVIDHHPAVGTLSDEDLAGAAIYYDAKCRVAQNNGSLTTVTNQIEGYTAETALIMKALGLEPAVDPQEPPAPEPAPTPDPTPEPPAPVPEQPVEAPVEPTPDNGQENPAA